MTKILITAKAHEAESAKKIIEALSCTPESAGWVCGDCVKAMPTEDRCEYFCRKHWKCVGGEDVACANYVADPR